MSNKAEHDCSELTEADIEGFLDAMRHPKPLSPKVKEAMRRAKERADRIMEARKKAESALR